MAYPKISWFDSAQESKTGSGQETPETVLSKLLENPDVNVLTDLEKEKFNSIPSGEELTQEFATKVDAVEGKALSTNDFTNELKEKLESIDNSTPTDPDPNYLSPYMGEQIIQVLSVQDETPNKEELIILDGRFYDGSYVNGLPQEYSKYFDSVSSGAPEPVKTDALLYHYVALHDRGPFVVNSEIKQARFFDIPDNIERISDLPANFEKLITVHSSPYATKVKYKIDMAYEDLDGNVYVSIYHSNAHTFGESYLRNYSRDDFLGFVTFAYYNANSIDVSTKSISISASGAENLPYAENYIHDGSSNDDLILEGLGKKVHRRVFGGVDEPGVSENVYHGGYIWWTDDGEKGFKSASYSLKTNSTIEFHPYARKCIVDMFEDPDFNLIGIDDIFACKLFTVGFRTTSSKKERNRKSIIYRLKSGLFKVICYEGLTGQNPTLIKPSLANLNQVGSARLITRSDSLISSFPSFSPCVVLEDGRVFIPSYVSNYEGTTSTGNWSGKMYAMPDFKSKSKTYINSQQYVNDTATEVYDLTIKYRTDSEDIVIVKKDESSVDAKSVYQPDAYYPVTPDFADPLKDAISVSKNLGLAFNGLPQVNAVVVKREEIKTMEDPQVIYFEEVELTPLPETRF